MRTIYRNITLAAATLFATSAFASNYFQATVPFDFTVGGKSIPTGCYDITMDLSQSFITLRSPVNPAMVVFATLGPADPAEASVVPRFEGIGESHSLERVLMRRRSTSNLNPPMKRNVKTPSASQSSSFAAALTDIRRFLEE
jgi:hypothetical protein